jgi:hypothetical protein
MTDIIFIFILGDEYQYFILVSHPQNITQSKHEAEFLRN